MSAFFLEGSPKTPHVNFDPETGLLELKGRSIPGKFHRVLQAPDRLGGPICQGPRASTRLHVQLEYFNTSSSKCILDLFKKLELVRATGNEVLVLWHYEADDEDMLEAGEDYQQIINLPFKMIQIEEVDGK
jgi:hypothetical protein